MKRLLSIILLLIAISSFSQISIQMTKKGGVWTIPCTINGMDLDFIFDSGEEFNEEVSLGGCIVEQESWYCKRDKIKF